MPEGVTKEVLVPFKYQATVAASQQGNFRRSLRNHGVQVDLPAQAQRVTLPARPAPEGISTARIDDDDTAAAPEVEWQVVENYQDSEEGDATWVLKGRDQAGLEKAEKMIEAAIQNAAKLSHVGFLTLADRSSFPRIVGSKGTTVARLRQDSGADITVSRDNNTIVIVGSESAVNGAKDAILEVVNSGPDRDRGGRQRRYRDD